MTPDIIANCPLSELPGMFPGKSPEELKRIRKRAKNALWQRRYRAEGRDVSTSSWINAGEPIGRCEEEDHYRLNAVRGSWRLARAIEQAGVRA